MAAHSLSMVTPCRRLAFLQIPKNASTRFRSLKEPHFGHNWTHEETLNIEAGPKHVVILRDPADRYLSAVNMFLRVEGNLFHLPILFKGYLTDDQHFQLQADYVKPVRHIPTTDYWMYDSNVVNDMIDHYELALSKKERSNAAPEKAVTAVDPAFIDKYYSEDLELISQVKFLNR